jgi:hexosaminidase
MSLISDIQAQSLSIIPEPASVKMTRTVPMKLDAKTQIMIVGSAKSELANIQSFLQEGIHVQTGISISSSQGAGSKIVLELKPNDAEIAEEGYTLGVNPRQTSITAKTARGLFYGVQTFLQLLPESETSVVQVPPVVISDAPRFAYRGMHLDVGRHFFPVSFIKKYIDLLAFHKMNTFHWHLTEDQGWRIEIKKYPKLTQVGAFRKETMAGPYRDQKYDGKPYGGFYTQEEVKDVVAYAQSRYVTIIPEIEMPGHSLAALTAYPNLACTAGPFEVGTKWGVFKDIYCPKEETFAFLQDVLTEVLALFPSKFIHIGGDEAPKDRWKESTIVQELKQKENLKDEHEVQSYFIRRIEKFLNSKGRDLIGWDEILEGGLSPNATVMSWRGINGGIAAAKEKHFAIMTPGTHCYLDHYQGDPRFEPLAIGGYNTLEFTYSYEPIPDALTAEEGKYILGAQGNVWTEYMKTPQYVEYMALPRMTALAEVTWSPKEKRNYTDFMRRMQMQYKRLDRMNVTYHIDAVQGLDDDYLVEGDKATIDLHHNRTDAIIRYTLDGTEPNLASPEFTKAWDVPLGENGVTVTARAFLPNGRAGVISRATVKKGTYAPAVTAQTSMQGLRYSFFEGKVAKVAELEGKTPTKSGMINTVKIPDGTTTETFGIIFNAYLNVPKDGIYTFRLNSDDGSVLWVDGQVVVDNDGEHAPVLKAGSIALKAGLHAVKVGFFEAGGDEILSLQWATRGNIFQNIPNDAWKH